VLEEKSIFIHSILDGSGEKKTPLRLSHIDAWQPTEEIRMFTCHRQGSRAFAKIGL